MGIELTIGDGLEDGSWRFGPFPRFVITKQHPSIVVALTDAPAATYIMIHDEDETTSFERALTLTRWMHENIGPKARWDWRVDRPSSRLIDVAIRDPRHAVAFKLRWWP